MGPSSLTATLGRPGPSSLLIPGQSVGWALWLASAPRARAEWASSGGRTSVLPGG
jgi:hypothetical protein